MSRILKFEVPPGKPVLRGQDYFWATMLGLDLKGPWTINDVRALCNGVHRSTIGEYVRRLVAGGFVHEDETGPDGKFYRVKTRQSTPPRPRRDGSTGVQGRGQVQMWNVIRGPISREGFTVKDVALYGSTEDIPVPEPTAASYVKHLAQAGYLVCVRKGKARQPGVWRLKPAMNTGPKPPLVLRAQIVFDQNRSEAIGPVTAEEVAS